MKHLHVLRSMGYSGFKNLRHFLKLYGVIVICCVSAFIVLWQSARITPLIDYSYQVENAFRIFQGDMPYRDFFLVVGPGTYEVMATLMHITNGYNHMVQIYFTMIVSVCTIILTYRILLLIGIRPLVSIFMVFPLLFSGQSIYPFPLYDPNVMLVMLLATYIFLYLRKHEICALAWYSIAGAACAVPIFFKQNTGGIFFLSTAGVLLLSVIVDRNRRAVHSFIAFMFGGIVVIAGIFLWLLINNALDQFIFQTLIFPRYSKNPMDAIRIILYQYVEYWDLYRANWRFSIISTGIFAGLLAWQTFIKKTFLHKSPSFFSVLIITLFSGMYFVHIFKDTDPIALHHSFILWIWVTLTIGGIISMMVSRFKHASDDVSMIFFPIVFITSVHATFLSHGIVDSSQHMWPFAIVLLGYIFNAVKSHITFRFWQSLGFCILIMLSAILARSVIQNYSMGFIDSSGEMGYATRKELLGLGTPGTWILNFEAMLKYTDINIPKNSSVAFLPGEDPFFAASGRKNPLQFSLLHAGVYTLQPSMVVNELLEKNVQWIVAKNTQQTYPWLWISNWEDISKWVKQSYSIVVTIGNYDIYKKI